MATNAEYQAITQCVARIRRRLWIVRLIERASFAITWAAAVSLFLVAARLVRDRFLWLAIPLAILPVLIAALLWFRKRPVRNGRRNRALPTQVITPTNFLTLLALLTLLPSAAAVVLLVLPTAAAIPIWLLPATTMVLFAILTAATVRPVDPRSAAIFIDQQVGLKERVATALEFIDHPPATLLESSFRAPVIASAIEACQTMDTANVRYARADQRLYAFAATATLAAAGICFLTPLPAAATPAQRRYETVIQKTQKLDKLLTELEQKKIPENTTAQQKLQPLKEALTDLRKGNMSPFEADARLNQEKGELQKQEDQMDAAEKVAKAMDNIKDLEDVAKAADKVKDANMKNANGDAGAAGNMQKANQDVKDAAKALGDKVKNGMSDADKQKLASDLKNASDQAKGDQQLKNDLQQAADAAQKGDGDKLSQAMANAGQRAGEQGAQQQLSGDAVRQAMDAINRANNDGKSNGESQASAGQQNGQNGDNSQQNGGGQNGGGQQGGQQGGGQQNDQQNQQAGGQNGGQDGQQQADSGQNGQGQQGGQQSGGQGSQAAQANAGQGQGQSSSQSLSGGSTNLHEKGSPGDHNTGHPLGGTSQFVKIYDEKSINSQGKMEQVSGKINPLAPASGTAEVFGQGDKADPTIKTYDSQLPAARKRALDDLQTQQIPPQYRDLIRNYYTQ